MRPRHRPALFRDEKMKKWNNSDIWTSSYTRLRPMYRLQIWLDSTPINIQKTQHYYLIPLRIIQLDV